MIDALRYQSGRLAILDQTQLPQREHYLKIRTKEDLWEAIHLLKVRGAPAIGIAAAYGLAFLAKTLPESSQAIFMNSLNRTKSYLASARPTAVNLTWALDRVMQAAEDYLQSLPAHAAWTETHGNLLRRMDQEAESIREEDAAACKAMGSFGLSLLSPGMGILTYCNAGILATASIGTSLSPLYLGHQQHYDFRIFACETRPLMQGARLTSWELMRSGMDVTLICDNMVATVMKNRWIDAVLVGCDRLAANGDGANKIGTSGLAILAKEYGIPFYMFVPTSTVDLSTATGEAIQVETRPESEITTQGFAHPMAPEGVKAFNPAFDVTDHSLITAIITEKGILYPPYAEALASLTSIGNEAKNR